jgi:hypothetical protein
LFQTSGFRTELIIGNDFLRLGYKSLPVAS